MADRAVTKQLAGAEDLLHGTGTQVQERASGPVSVTKIDASVLVYEQTTAIETIREKISKKTEVVNDIASLKAIATGTVAERFVSVLYNLVEGDNGGGLFYLDTTDTTSLEDLSTVFYPDDLANGRWKRVNSGSQLSSDNGDANIVLVSSSMTKQLFASALSANRLVTLPSTNLYKGLTFTIVRTDTSQYTIDIGGVVVLPLAGRMWVEVTYDGSAWVQTAAGSLI